MTRNFNFDKIKKEKTNDGIIAMGESTHKHVIAEVQNSECFKRLSFKEKHNSDKSNKYDLNFKGNYIFKFNHGAFGDSYINKQLKAVV